MVNKSNQQLYDEALEAITLLFSDQRISRSKAIENLQTLILEIETMIDSLNDGEIEEEEEEEEEENGEHL